MNPSPSNSPQLRLTRYVQLSAQDAKFTFVPPASLFRGFITELESAIFEYANTNWRLKLVRSPLHIGAYLELVLPRMAVAGGQHTVNFAIWLDLTLTVVNLTHFSDNQTFSEEQVLFNRNNTCRGSGCLIEATVVTDKKFVGDDGRLLIELELANAILNINLFLMPRSEDFFESAEFLLDGEVWKLEMLIDWDDRVKMCLNNQSASQNLVYLVSFEMVITPELDSGHQVTLCLHHNESQFTLPANLNMRILSNLTNLLMRRLIPIWLKNVKVYKGVALSLPRELTKEPWFLTLTKDKSYFQWSVVFSGRDGRLHPHLLPLREEKSVLEANTLRTIGWSWCLLSHPQAGGGSLRQMHISHQSLFQRPWRHFVATDIPVSKETEENFLDTTQSSVHEDEGSEYACVMSPDVPHMKVLVN